MKILFPNIGTIHFGKIKIPYVRLLLQSRTLQGFQKGEADPTLNLPLFDLLLATCVLQEFSAKGAQSYSHENADPTPPIPSISKHCGLPFPWR